MLKVKILFGLCLVSFLFISLNQLMTNPPIWPDETYYSDIALNLLQQGRIGTDIWGEMIKGLHTHFYWYPPGLFFIYAAEIKLFGLSIYNQRLLTVFVSLLFVIIYYQFVKILLELENLKSKKIDLIALIPVLLLIFDQYFLQASRISRPEMYVLLSGFSGMLLLLKTERKKSNSLNLNYFFSGLFLSIGVIIHLSAMVYLVAVFIYIVGKYKLTLLKSANLKLLILGIFIPLSVWIIWLLPNSSFFFSQINLQNQFRTLTLWTLQMELYQGDIYKKLLICFYIVWSLILLVRTVFSYIKGQYHLLLVSTALIFSWVYLDYGKLGWYTVFIVPFIYISYIIYLNDIFISKGKFLLSIKNKKAILTIFVTISFIIFISSNIQKYIQDTIDNVNHEYDYELFTQNLLKVIPDNKTIYLSSIPDAYYSFKENRKNNKLYKYPPLLPNFSEYINLLNDSDYIVINFNPEAMFTGNFLNKYIELNKDNIIKFNESAGYSVFVIKLKPSSKRVLPTD